MFGGFDILVASMAFHLVSQKPVVCSVPNPPKINIKPMTDEIQYDFSRSMDELGQQRTDTVNPYSPNVDTATGGLRKDQPEMRLNVKMGTRQYPSLGVFCVWYEEIDFEIQLKPEIYVAKEFNYRPCRQAILDHELKHVTVDRKVINKYARVMGEAIRDAVNEVGALGPYNLHNIKTIEQQMMDHVQSAIGSKQILLEREMRQLQAQVDSLQEYEAVSKYCTKVVDRRR